MTGAPRTHPSFLTPARQGKRPKPSTSVGPPPGQAKSTQDWVVTLRKLLNSAKSQDAQLKRLQVAHHELRKEAEGLQFALAHAGLIPKAELISTASTIDPRSDGEGLSPGLAGSFGGGNASMTGFPPGALDALPANKAALGDGKAGKQASAPAGDASPAAGADAQGELPAAAGAAATHAAATLKSGKDIELSLNQVWEPSPQTSLVYSGSPAFVNAVNEHTVRKHDQKDLWEMCKPLLDGTAPLATQKARLAAVQQVLNIIGSDLERWSGPEPAIVAAVNANHVELTHMFLRARANPNVSDHRGLSVLHLAAFNGNIQIAKSLIQNQADVNARDGMGQTPMFFASRTGICKVLTEKKADLKLLNVKGQSALHLVAHNGFTEVLNWLSARVPRSLVDHHDIYGNTAELCLRQRAMVRKDAVSLDRHDMGYKSRRMQEAAALITDGLPTRRFSMVDEAESQKPSRCNSIERLYEELDGGDKGGQKKAERKSRASMDSPRAQEGGGEASQSDSKGAAETSDDAAGKKDEETPGKDAGAESDSGA
eukprot:TRINITY_DN121127_c0_g1_i1.p1 TRINITY_DN121127_c0_g1~~TRINITY_DN121127_c0_g1_i1.p1  ORF type:complete len:541 (+),score=138.44 TRINITY_DN121127_c0_g1_i1:118-1740(+)